MSPYHLPLQHEISYDLLESPSNYVVFVERSSPLSGQPTNSQFLENVLSLPDTIMPQCDRATQEVLLADLLISMDRSPLIGACRVEAHPPFLNGRYRNFLNSSSFIYPPSYAQARVIKKSDTKAMSAPTSVLPSTSGLRRSQRLQGKLQPRPAQHKLETKLPPATKPRSLIPWAEWNAKTRLSPRAEGVILQGRRVNIRRSQLRRPTIVSQLPSILQIDNPYAKCNSKGAGSDGPSLDPRLWQHLPHDILFNVINHLSLSDQVNWSRVSRGFFQYASSKMWSQVSIRPEEVEAYSDHENHLEPLNREKSVIQFLVRGAYRKDKRLVFGQRDKLRSLDDPLHIYQPQSSNAIHSIIDFPAPLPGMHVKILKIEPSDDTEAEEFDHALRALIGCMPNLSECLIEGRLYGSSLGYILTAEKLRKLHIRTWKRHGIDRDVWPSARPDQIVDTTLLGNLANLTNLNVGFLLLQEANGLAKSVKKLRLERLMVSCSRTAYDESTDRWIDDPRTNPSPLIQFLSEILRHDTEDDISGFPGSLKNLTLCDFWHYPLPNLHQDIYRAIQPCRDLLELSIAIPLDFERYKALKGLPLYTYQRTLRVSSWERLNSDVEIQWISRYIHHSGKWQTASLAPGPETVIHGPLSKFLDSLIADKHSISPIQKATVILRSSGLPENAMYMRPAKCHHKILHNRCYICGQGYEYDSEEVEDLTKRLRDWSISPALALI